MQKIVWNDLLLPSLEVKNRSYGLNPRQSGQPWLLSHLPLAAVYSINPGFSGMLFVMGVEPRHPEAFSPQMNVYASRARAWGAPDGELPTCEEMPPSKEVEAALD